MADMFANVANLAVTESAANTITFEKLETGAGIFEKMAMVISRIEYEPSAATLNLMVDAADEFRISWVTSDQLTSLAKEGPNVIATLECNVYKQGTPASAHLVTIPFVQDFTTLPAGGLIVPATHIWCAVVGTSLTSPGYVRSSIFFTYKSLKGEEYWELVEATRALA